VDPGFAKRPVRPDVNISKNFNLNQRNISNNAISNNVVSGRWNQFNNNQQQWNRAGLWNQPSYNGQPAQDWGRPWYGTHQDWHQGYMNYWGARPALWAGSGLASGWMAAPDAAAFDYSNPYYTEPASNTVVAQQFLNYLQPIPLPTADQADVAYPPALDTSSNYTDDTGVAQDMQEAAEAAPAPPPPPPQTDDPIVTEANSLFESARKAFRDGDYVAAQKLVEKAIAKLPSDATLHEYRALTLFAQERFPDAAGALYAVLAAGPGWSWETMISLYPNVEVYTQQLRALEEYARKDPTSGSAHFLLAYHYLVMGSKDNAVEQLEKVVKLEPRDKLSAELLKTLTGGGTGGGDASAPPKPDGG
jgi:tetratricopeptide (TPR) repeat protein